MKSEKWAVRLLRAGLAFAFIYPAISSLIDPLSWTGFIPVFIKNIIEPKLFLLIFSVSELILGVWLLSGFKARASAALSALVMFSITLFNLTAFEIVFRDISLGFASLSLLLSIKE